MTEKKYNLSELPQTEHIYCPKTGELCHIVRRAVYEKPGYTRDDIVPTKESLQVARVKSDAGKVFKPHQHKQHDAPQSVKGECWIVISGAAEAHLYGVESQNAGKYFKGEKESQYIKSVVMRAGDVLVSLRGGHGYRILSDATVIVEVKSGPYTGVHDDKTFIEHAQSEPTAVSELWKHNETFAKGIQAGGPQNNMQPVPREKGQESQDVPDVLGEGAARTVQTPTT